MGFKLVYYLATLYFVVLTVSSTFHRSTKRTEIINELHSPVDHSDYNCQLKRVFNKNKRKWLDVFLQKKQMSESGETWKEQWYGMTDVVKRVYEDDDIEMYYDNKMNRNTVDWNSNLIRNVWRYTKDNYGGDEGFGGEGILYPVIHNRSGVNTALTFLQSETGGRNIIEIFQYNFNDLSEDIRVIIHEVFHLVEALSFGRRPTGGGNAYWSAGYGNPPNGIWGDSIMAELFIYDVEKGLRMNSEAEATKKKFDKSQQNIPKAGIFWFRDWLYPWYIKGGGTKTITTFFRLLAQKFPSDRSMNWGEYIHFSSGAAGSNMKNLATKVFGWSDTIEKQFKKAQKDFPSVTY